MGIVLAGASFCWTLPVAAAPVVIPLDSADNLTSEGFEHHSSDGSSLFSDGMMLVETDGFEEWMLRDGTASKWWDSVHPTKGWWVEARLRVNQALECPGPGIWINDGAKLFRLRFGDGILEEDQSGKTAAVDTSVFHVYRIEDYGDGTRRITVDDAEVIDLSDASGGSGSSVFSIGDLGGCGPSSVTWDSISYDTFAPGREGDDDDADGVANAEDNCFEDSNPDQSDTDMDGLGDVCDPCPVDAQNDRDGDGVCDSEDGCPDDGSTTEPPCGGGSTGWGGYDGDTWSSGNVDDSDSDSGSDSTSGFGSGVVSGSEGGLDDPQPGTGGCGCRGGGPSDSLLWCAGVLALALRRRRDTGSVSARTPRGPA